MTRLQTWIGGAYWLEGEVRAGLNVVERDDLSMSPVQQSPAIRGN